MISNSRISISPNPVSTLLNIDIQGTLDYTIRIFDVEGKPISIHNSYRFIEVDRFDAGVYLLEITDLNSGKRIIERIVVSK